MTAAALPEVTLRWLLEPWVDEALPAASIQGLTPDTRRLEPGAVFLALPGSRDHGLAYVPAALQAGAAAVVWDPQDEVDPGAARTATEQSGVPMVGVPGLRRHLGAIAGRLYGDPSRGMEVIAVTGTDGKTSVSHFIAQLLSGPEAPWGVVGTLGHGLVDDLRPGVLTTPDAAALQKALAECRAAGATGVAMEASSHALEQGRLAGTAVDLAVLTHLGRDHLDYHGSVEAYADAKSRLFEFPSLRAQVLNLDDALGRRLHDRAAGAAFTYSAAGAAADLAAEAVIPGADGVQLTLCVGGTRHSVRLPLFGHFNVANVLAAVAAALALGRPMDGVLARLPTLRPVPGRMEQFHADGSPLVVVDYAHTPGALEQALTALRAHTTGRLCVVFGCGGERDTGKRPLMGEVAARLADRVLITDDNPRGEDAAVIRAAVAAGAGEGAEVVAGRGVAIGGAIAWGAPGDVVLIAGKGHETEQEIDGQRFPFSDREEVARLLSVPREAAWIR
ncbi:UDP-N-acetylmuramoyl-L-alanyl-D-glutamate--2,6-diaminopimelate ligase [Halorhodospira halophila]|uniref:UDP-N-acetylmuramoyl-L-alanyl-D-glutamate--2,6-diaminopimelate ligase n=1 Tax=Halorhodospira halophila (strain DSM 244 / SL1) TaxID=349124 RepID=A1WYU8_HALHL|nr:UDP-N-acetylmuramoyl-L-alanyl-D-glutamate--2,6-diaminopimelate ligase [Halorhodospira halophila]ABM62860.1 UDP-N-acetylmuramoylalanyl-D-glutamate--2,6-diaminopimelate ligase [Halorhodospira halophila SL1]MBK1728017.1 UDP-N-acetylmuramoyl-L-alanyl-D-glutamate--2,6-diaminopimelate ligase [Halorhodospira halophila]